MEPKNIISVIIGLFVILVLTSLFGGRELFTSNAVATFSDSVVTKGDYVTVSIGDNLYGVSRDASIIRGGSSCSSASESQLDIVLCNKERCEGSIEKAFSTTGLDIGHSYKLRYREFTTPSNIGESRETPGSLSMKWRCTSTKFRVA